MRAIGRLSRHSGGYTAQPGQRQTGVLLSMDRGKVRVFSSVLAGYQFLFGRFFRLLHVAWFPGVLFVTAGIFAHELTRQINVANMANSEVRGALIYMLEIMTIYSLFQLAMTLVVVVGFYRIALHNFKPRAPLYFRFRNDELRTAGVWFLVIVALYALFMALVYILVFFVATYISASGDGAGYGPASSGPLATMVELVTTNSSGFFGAWLGISMLLMYWVYARFFLAMPAALEHKVTTLGEVWGVTKGNGIRLTVYVVALVISLVLFTLALGYLILFAQMVAAFILVTILPPDAVGAVAEKSADIETVINGLPLWGRFLVAGLSQIGVFFTYIFFWAIVIGSASAAFRCIWPDESE